MENISDMSVDKDHILRISLRQGRLRALIATAKDTVQEAHQRHDTSAVASAALGRLLIAGGMMGTFLKEKEDLITLRIKADGPLGGALVTANNQGEVKGYVGNPHAEVANYGNGKLNVAGVIGQGHLTVTRDGYGEPYQSTVALQSGEVAEDITYYFAQSEQTPSVVALGVLVERDLSIRAAGGFIVQLLPGADEEDICFLEERLRDLPAVTSLLDQGLQPKDIALRLFAPEDFQVLERLPLTFTCHCNRQRVEKALISLGKEELAAMIAEDGEAEINCHFCNSTYVFSNDELQTLCEN